MQHFGVAAPATLPRSKTGRTAALRGIIIVNQRPADASEAPPTIKRLEGGDAVAALLRNANTFSLENANLRRQAATPLLDLAGDVPIVDFDYPGGTHRIGQNVESLTRLATDLAG